MYRATLNFSSYPQLQPGNWYRIHQWIIRYCHKDPRVLFQVKEDGVLIQTQNQMKLPSCEAELYKPNFSVGERRTFEIIANPSKKNRKRYVIHDENIRQEWIERKMSGACDIEWVLQENWNQVSWKRKKNKKTPEIGDFSTYFHFACRFYGMLRITDTEKMLEPISSGIGSGKAFGLLIC